MFQVWKFQLDEGENEVTMPVDAEILSVGVGTQGLSMLALVTPDAETVERRFVVVGNGVDLPEGVGAVHFRGAVKLPSLSVAVFETTHAEVAA